MSYHTGQSLNSIMEFDHVIRVNEDGSVSDENDVYAPDIYIETDDDGQILDEHERAYIADANDQGWDLMTGYTDQSGYSGPIMHPSEFIGEDMADDILESPGIYVVIEVSSIDGGDSDPIGWAVAYRADESYQPTCRPVVLT
jgi:hypothetical protein